jgi:MFS family permease
VNLRDSGARAREGCGHGGEAGAAGLAVIYLAMGFCYRGGVQGLPMLLLVLAAIGCYAMSLAPVTWVVISEIFPNRIRRHWWRSRPSIVACFSPTPFPS